jgi:hypothetical protein
MALTIAHSGFSAPSARILATALTDLGVPAVAARTDSGHVNWGRRTAASPLNPDTSFAANKRAMRLRFHEHDIPTPRLLTYFDARTVVMNNGTVVGRPDRHSRRNHMYVVDNIADLDRALCGGPGSSRPPATHFFEWVSAPREYRVHVFGGRSIRLSEKDFTSPTEHRLYSTVRPDRENHPVDHVREAAKAAVAAVSLDFGAVDVLADNDSCWVLEVNSAPGLGGSTMRVYAENIIRYFEEEGRAA